MRKALYSELKKIKPVYHAGNILKTTKKPYFILKAETEIRTRQKSFTPFSVFVYADAGDIFTLDDLCERAIKALSNKRIERVEDKSIFIVEYEGASGDFVDDELKAIGRRLSFNIPIFGKDFM